VELYDKYNSTNTLSMRFDMKKDLHEYILDIVRVIIIVGCIVAVIFILDKSVSKFINNKENTTNSVIKLKDDIDKHNKIIDSLNSVIDGTTISIGGTTVKIIKIIDTTKIKLKTINTTMDSVKLALETSIKKNGFKEIK